MRFCRTISSTIDKINTFVGEKSSYLVLVFMLLTVYEVLTRRLLNSPTIWTYETIIMTFGIYIILTCGYGIVVDALVSVDVLSKKFPKKVRDIIQVITYAFIYMPFVGLTLYKTIPYVINSYNLHEVSNTVWGPLLWPFKLTLLVGLALLFLQCISQLIKALYELITGKRLLGGVNE